MMNKPLKLDLMLKLASKLAKDFYYARIDFYEIFDKFILVKSLIILEGDTQILHQRIMI